MFGLRETSPFNQIGAKIFYKDRTESSDFGNLSRFNEEKCG